MRVSLSHPIARLVSRALKPLGFGIYTLPQEGEVTILVRRGAEVSEGDKIECLEKMARFERRNYERDFRVAGLAEEISCEITRDKFTGGAR